MIILIVISAFDTVTKRLLKGLEDLEIRGWVETIQNITLFKSAWIPRRIQETCCHSDFNERPSANTDVKNSQGVNKAKIDDTRKNSKSRLCREDNHMWTNSKRIGGVLVI